MSAPDVQKVPAPVPAAPIQSVGSSTSSVAIDAETATVLVRPPRAQCMASCDDTEFTALHFDNIKAVTMKPFGVSCLKMLLNYSRRTQQNMGTLALVLAALTGFGAGFYLFWLICLLILGIAYMDTRMSARPGVVDAVIHFHAPAVTLPFARMSTLVAGEDTEQLLSQLWSLMASYKNIKFFGFEQDDLRADPSYGLSVSGDVLRIRYRGQWFVTTLMQLAQVRVQKVQRGFNPTVIFVALWLLLTIVIDLAGGKFVSLVVTIICGGACVLLTFLTVLGIPSSATVELRFRCGEWVYLPAPSVEEGRLIALRLLQLKAGTGGFEASQPVRTFVDGTGRPNRSGFQNELKIHPMFVEGCITRLPMGCLARCCCQPDLIDWQGALLSDTNATMCYRTGVRDEVFNGIVLVTFGLLISIVLLGLTGAAAVFIIAALSLVVALVRIVIKWCQRGSFVALGEPLPGAGTALAAAGVLNMTFGAAQWKSSVIDPAEVVSTIVQLRGRTSLHYRGVRGGTYEV